MVEWSISRHPEWDLMYAAGLTVREISELCHGNIATISLHFRTREKFEPGVQQRHKVALSERHPDRPSARWKQSLIRLGAFVEKHGRLPELGDEDGGDQLYRWLAVQRRSFQKGQMSPGKIFLLSDLANWHQEPHVVKKQEEWEFRLSEVIEFQLENGYLPHYHSFRTSAEHKLGVWLHYQHQRRNEKLLSFDRQRSLEEALPGWRSSW